MTNTALIILVIEDEAPIRRFLRASLPSHGYRLEEAETGEAGLLKAAIYRPDLIILDLGLPDMDGLEVAKRLREWSTKPIIVLSAREREEDKIAALDAGADDYLTKPFGTGELLARLRAAFRRANRPPGETVGAVLCIGALRIDWLRRQVWLDEQEVHLTPIEYRLLITLAQHAGKVLTHPQLLAAVWGPNHGQASHSLRVYMGMLRRKLEVDATRPRYLLTEPGVGYRLAAE